MYKTTLHLRTIGVSLMFRKISVVKYPNYVEKQAYRNYYSRRDKTHFHLLQISCFTDTISAHLFTARERFSGEFRLLSRTFPQPRSYLTTSGMRRWAPNSPNPFNDQMKILWMFSTFVFFVSLSSVLAGPIKSSPFRGAPRLLMPQQRFPSRVNSRNITTESQSRETGIVKKKKIEPRLVSRHCSINISLSFWILLFNNDTNRRGSTLSITRFALSLLLSVSKNIFLAV